MSQKSKAYLVKPNIGFIGVMREYFDPNYLPNYQIHQLFVPERFVLGDYTKINSWYRLDEKNVKFRGTSEAVKIYKEALEKKKLEIVESLELHEEVILEIIRKGGDYTRAKEDLIKRTNNLIGNIMEYSLKQ